MYHLSYLTNYINNVTCNNTILLYTNLIDQTEKEAEKELITYIHICSTISLLSTYYSHVTTQSRF